MKFDDADLLSLADAARVLPGNVTPSTLSRWALTGQRGILIETLRIGGRVYTSRTALQNFFDSVSKAAVRRPRSKHRKPTFVAVDAELRKRGFRV